MFPIGDSLKPSSFPVFTKGLVAVNVIVFLWSIMSDYESIIYQFGFTPIIFSLQTLFTSMFLHGGVEHLLGNMLYLWIFGDNVEDYYGKIMFLPFYLATGIIASLIHWLSDPFSVIPAIGASGAISGVLGAYLVLYPNADVKLLTRFGIQLVSAKFMIGLWFVFQLVYALASMAVDTMGVAFWAHVGGFLGGWFITKLAIKKKKPKHHRPSSYYVRFYGPAY
jgi:membrane associated rhomboid family serine protease